MLTKPTGIGAINDEFEPETCRIAFVGEAGVGKTTIAALVAARLTERTRVNIAGEAAKLVDDCDADTGDGLDMEWVVADCPPGVDAIDARPERLDAVFVVATVESLERVETYERRATRYDVDCFLVLNRFRESARDRLQTFDGPVLAEYVYDNEAIPSAIDEDRVPDLPEWTVEAILIEALQPERQDAECALETLKRGHRSIVNVEVEERTDADPLVDSFESAGFSAAYFECNCRCHDGHVLARR
ncbi:hypothetical protein C482_14599 [Natrialba chahannaoensis JCM 10990]|uniref:Uncharacterized protein n=1 Tax=Natrialba chahannaoensis JCM 10990 TaxID=1227492 RepID=M0AES9_9EURY|nr:hypothetical protein [Natrialba chahannaoensis]ELY97009.1 hypothetical protein C482_14599 [Natrialba chahannaoensis JCM 10990]